MTSRKSPTRVPRTSNARASQPGATPHLARVFWSGRSQAVRLPKDFRVDEDVLLISRRGKALVLEPRDTTVDAKGWPRSFWRLFGAVPDDFDLGRRDEPPEQRAPFEDE